MINGKKENEINNKVDETQNMRIMNVQSALKAKSKSIFQGIIKELDTHHIELVKFRGLISLFPNVELKDKVKQIVTNYHLPQKLLKGEIENNTINAKLNETDFCDLIRGCEIKTVLFEKNLDEKRTNFEELYTLYNFMGGNGDGISKNNLSFSIAKALNLYVDPHKYMSDGFNPDDVKKDYSSNYLQNSHCYLHYYYYCYYSLHQYFVVYYSFLIFNC